MIFDVILNGDQVVHVAILGCLTLCNSVIGDIFMFSHKKDCGHMLLDRFGG